MIRVANSELRAAKKEKMEVIYLIGLLFGVFCSLMYFMDSATEGNVDTVKKSLRYLAFSFVWPLVILFIVITEAV